MSAPRITMVALLVLACMANAEELGARAQTWSVDADGREQLKVMARKKVEDGSFTRFKDEYVRNTINAIKNPAPLGIAVDYSRRTVYITPKFVFSSDFKDDKGRVVVRRGTTVEPLRINPLSSDLLFIDGRDERQVAFALQRYKARSTKIILVAGSAWALRTRFKDELVNGVNSIPFYFDQKAMLIKQFDNLYHLKISQVPALIAQTGDQLKVDFGL